MFRIAAALACVVLIASVGCQVAAPSPAPLAQSHPQSQDNVFHEVTAPVDVSQDARTATLKYVAEGEGWMSIFNRLTR